jgi:hypothetical protein
MPENMRNIFIKCFTIICAAYLILGELQKMIWTQDTIGRFFELSKDPTIGCIICLVSLVIMFALNQKEDEYLSMQIERDALKLKLNEIPNVSGDWKSDGPPDKLFMTLSQNGKIVKSEKDSVKGRDFDHSVSWEYLPTARVFKSQSIRKLRGSTQECVTKGYAIVLNSNKILGVTNETSGVDLPVDYMEVRTFDKQE